MGVICKHQELDGPVTGGAVVGVEGEGGRGLMLLVGESHTCFHIFTRFPLSDRKSVVSQACSAGKESVVELRDCRK